MNTLRMPILLSGLAVSALLLVLAMFGLLWQADAAKKWVIHTLNVQLTTEQLLGTLRDAETGQRGYLLTPDATFLEPYEAARVATPAKLKQLRDLTTDNSIQQQRIGLLEGLIQRKFAVIALTVGLQQAGEREKVLEVVSRHEGRRVMDEIRRVIASMLDTESDLLDTRQTKAEWLMTLARGTCVAIAALIIGLAVSVFRMMAGQVEELEAVVTDRTRHLGVVSAELAHRTKNQLALVQSIANQTARHSSSTSDFLEKFGSRLEALGRSISELTRQKWRSASLSSLVTSQLDWLPDAVARERIVTQGPDVMLSPTAAHYLGLALHELVTNALKYGALSVDPGRVSIVWSVAPRRADGARQLHLVWSESGGPPLEAAPARKGFGSTILTKLTAAALHGEATIAYLPAGLRWTLVSPAPMEDTAADLAGQADGFEAAA